MLESDPLYGQLKDVLAASSLQAGPLYTAFKDLALSVEWHDLRASSLGETGWTIIVGHKRRQDPMRVVLPLPLHTTALKPSSLKSIFAALADFDSSDLPKPLAPLVPSISSLRQQIGKDDATAESHDEEVNDTLDRDMLYIAIVTTDSTVVYYKLNKGIKKPADIPDE